MPLPPRPRIKPLSALCIDLLATHSGALRDLGGLDEHTGVVLLREVVARQKLTLPLARVFIRSFPDSELSHALRGLDLFAAIPPAVSGPRSGLGPASW